MCKCLYIRTSVTIAVVMRLGGTAGVAEREVLGCCVSTEVPTLIGK